MNFMGKLKEFWITYFGGLYLSHHAVGLVSIWKSLGKTKPCALDQYTIKMYLRTFSCSRVALFYHWKVFNVITFSAEPFPNYIIKMYLTRVSENECIWAHSVVPDLLYFFISEMFLLFNVITFSVEPFPNDNIKNR